MKNTKCCIVLLATAILGVNFNNLVSSLNITFPLHLQVSNAEARIAAGCLLPIDQVDQHILSKIPGVSSNRALLIDQALKNSSNFSSLKSEREQISFYEKINGIGPKTASTLIKYIGTRQQSAVCNVLIK